MTVPTYPSFDPNEPGQPGDPTWFENPDSEEPEEPKKKKRRGGLLLLVLAILLAVTGVVIGVWNFLPQSGSEVDMVGNRVQPDPDAVVPEAEASANPDLGMRFKVPSVKLDVPLGISNAVNGVIAPPGFKSAFLIRNMGVSLDKATEGTVYVAAHSLRNGGVAPGNYLIDVDNQQAKVKAGDIIEVSNLTYTITETRIIPKPDVSDANDLWEESVPKRLIVFTCLQNPQNQPSRDNMIIIATLNE